MLQQVFPVLLYLQGDGAALTFNYSLSRLLETGVNPFTKQPVVAPSTLPSSAVLNPSSLGSAAIDAAGNITVTLLVAPVAGAVTPIEVDLLYANAGNTTVNNKSVPRTSVTYSATGVAAGATGVETAITLGKSSAGAAIVPAVSHVVPAGKTLRVQCIIVASRGHATATAQITTFSLRANGAGAVVVGTTPVLMPLRSATPATASAYDRWMIEIPDGYEIVGNGTLQIGLTANSVFVTNAPTWDVFIVGYEY